MTVLDTNMHAVTFLITVFESVMLFFAFIWYLQRLEDSSRLRYIFLLILLIQYNVFSGFFPDPGINIPVQIQTILAYFGGISVSMFFVYYIYKTFDLQSLKFYAIQGSIWFLLLPFIVLFIVPYMITGDANMSRKLVVIMPIIFSLLYVYALTRSLWKRYQETTSQVDREEIIGVYISVLLWATLPIIVFFDGSQLVENATTNTGFMIMSILFVRSAIFKSREDYNRILKSKEDLRNANQTLQQKVEERTSQLEKANEQQMNVFVNMVHETKTPLTLINNYLDEVMVKYGSCEEMDITKLSVDKLNRNMNNFFDIHKLDRGLQIYDHTKVLNFSTDLHEIVSIFIPFAKQKSIDISFEIHPDVYIKADSLAIDSICSNLIENAIKYNKTGGTIQIELKIQQDQILLIVSDDGIGISEEHQRKIFMPYYQINHKKSNTQGIGMGLALVKKAVESLGGNINLESNSTTGTKFTITLSNYVFLEDDQPVTLPPRRNIGIREIVLAPIELEEDLSKKSILIIEDNQQLLGYLQKKLGIDYNIFLARNGVDAIHRLSNLPKIPDLIISDIMMDEMDGYELLQSLRKHGSFSHIPVIFLSAIAEHAQRIKGLELGAVDFISKPFKIAELKLKIRSLLLNIQNQKLALINQASLLMNGVNGVESVKTMSIEDKCSQLKLTPRQIEIVKLALKGNSYAETGEVLFISPRTVAKHTSNIFSKLNIKSRFELIDLLESIN